MVNPQWWKNMMLTHEAIQQWFMIMCQSLTLWVNWCICGSIVRPDTKKEDCNLGIFGSAELVIWPQYRTKMDKMGWHTLVSMIYSTTQCVQLFFNAPALVHTKHLCLDTRPVFPCCLKILTVGCLGVSRFGVHRVQVWVNAGTTTENHGHPSLYLPSLDTMGPKGPLKRVGVQLPKYGL